MRLKLELAYRKGKRRLAMGLAMIEDLTRFFFKAAVNTYAADAPKGEIAELPNSRVYRFEDGTLRYGDIYFAGDALGSVGQTIIWEADIPRWWMQYHGWCKDSSATKFLKHVLRHAYQERLFRGGRGPEFFYDEEVSDLLYINRVARNWFNDFEGEEEIRRPIQKGGEVLFWHRYHGGTLH